MVNEKKSMTTKKVFEELKIDVDPKDHEYDAGITETDGEIAKKAVSVNAKVIVFDEPTSSLYRAGSVYLFDIIEMLKREDAESFYISHKMAEIKRISDESRSCVTKPGSNREKQMIWRWMISSA